jgi:CRP-like cAMP-binding protein
MVKGKKVQRKTSRQLSEGDFFGEIYPFEEEKRSPSSVETLSRVELVVITKEKMMAVCKRYPNIELGIIDLHKTRAQAEEETRRMVRKAQRHQMAIKMDIEVYPEEAGRSPLVLSGFSRDISLGGVCVVLDPKYKDVFPSYMIGRTARIRIMLSNEAITLSILGTIAWTTQVAVEGRTTEALGIQFKEMAPKLSGTLVAFASIISDF